MRVIVILLSALSLLFAYVPAASAHGTRSVSVDVSEVAPGKAIIRLRSTLVATDVKSVRVELSQPCAMTSAQEGGEGREGDHDVMIAECPGGIAGAEVTIHGLGPILTEAILIVALTDGQKLTRVLTAGEPSFVLPAIQTRGEVARSYVRLGVIHILTGYDHLLFLVGLVLLLRRARAVLLAETAFTVSHSLSFSATALGLVHVSAPAAEAAIALSLVLVALDIGKEHSPAPLLPNALEPSERQGILMAFVFGLVHGLGFAGGLREIGLPDMHVPLALLGFAGGVEIGQVAFLLLALFLLRVATKKLSPARIEAGVRVGYLAIGSISTYWLLERIEVLFSSRV